MRRSVVFGLAALIAVAAVAVSTSAADKQAKLSKTDRLLVQAQKICPVSGKDLESMGGPVKTEVQEMTIFLCCKGCVGQKFSKEHWAKLHVNLIGAQEKCPVMGKPLPKRPAMAVVEKRAVFVCCRPCTKKIEADSKKYLAVVDKFLEENLETEDEQK